MSFLHLFRVDLDLSFQTASPDPNKKPEIPVDDAVISAYLYCYKDQDFLLLPEM